MKINGTYQQQIDAILDKIIKDGVESLAASEKRFLKQFSTEIDKPESSESVKYNFTDGTIMVMSSKSNVPLMQFIFNGNIEQHKDEIIYYGSFFIYNFKQKLQIKFQGRIFCHGNGEFGLYDFLSVTEDKTYPIGTPLEDIIVDYDLEREIYLFFKNEVCPKLTDN